MPAATPFALMESAEKFIRELLDEYRSRSEKVAIPAIVWIDSRLNNEKVDSQPAIGFYEDPKEIAQDVMLVDGLQIVLAVSNKDRALFDGKTIDCERGRLFIR